MTDGKNGRRTNTETMTLRFTNAQRHNISDLDAKAAQLGLTRNQMAMKAIDLVLGMDADFLAAISLWSQQLGIEQSLMLENPTAEWFAELAARAEVFPGEQQVMPTFPLAGNSVLRGKPFYEHRRAQFVAHFMAQKEEQEAAAGS